MMHRRRVLLNLALIAAAVMLTALLWLDRKDERGRQTRIVLGGEAALGRERYARVGPLLDMEDKTADRK